MSNWDHEFINGAMTDEKFPRSETAPKSSEPPTVVTEVQTKDVVGPDMVGYRVADFVNDNVDVFQAPRI